MGVSLGSELAPRASSPAFGGDPGGVSPALGASQNRRRSQGPADPLFRLSGAPSLTRRTGNQAKGGLKMDAESFRLSPEQERQARAMGYIDGTCPTCDGRGEFSAPKVGSPTGRITRPCGSCGSLGRVWATEMEWEKYDLRGLKQPKSDCQMAEVLERASQ
jgi:hypothetical protein